MARDYKPRAPYRAPMVPRRMTAARVAQIEHWRLLGAEARRGKHNAAALPKLTPSKQASRTFTRHGTTMGSVTKPVKQIAKTVSRPLTHGLLYQTRRGPIRGVYHVMHPTRAIRRGVERAARLGH
jgi:hypothetical protein